MKVLFNHFINQHNLPSLNRQAVEPDLSDFTKLDKVTDLSFGTFTLSISDQTGAIIRLKDQTGREWCDEDHALGLFQYDVYNKSDYDRQVNDKELILNSFLLVDVVGVIVGVIVDDDVIITTEI